MRGFPGGLEIEIKSFAAQNVQFVSRAVYRVYDFTEQESFYENLGRLTEAKSLNMCNRGKVHLDFMGAEAFEWN